jgi:hypothetical protein
MLVLATTLYIIAANAGETNAKRPRFETTGTGNKMTLLDGFPSNKRCFLYAFDLTVEITKGTN